MASPNPIETGIQQAGMIDPKALAPAPGFNLIQFLQSLVPQPPPNQMQQNMSQFFQNQQKVNK